MERKADRKRGVELMVGLFVVAGFAALLFTALQAANLGSFSWSQKTYTVEAMFDNIGGLKPRAPVKSAGVVIGRVESVNFEPFGRAHAHRFLRARLQPEKALHGGKRIGMAGLLDHDAHAGQRAGIGDGNGLAIRHPGQIAVRQIEQTPLLCFIIEKVECVKDLFAVLFQLHKAKCQRFH